MIPLRRYAQLLQQVKNRIISARISAARQINSELIHLYWDIGRVIVEKQAIEGWGDAVVEKLATDLCRDLPDPRGYSQSNLWRMRKLYTAYSTPEFLAQLVPEMGPTTTALEQTQRQLVEELLAPVPWGHHVEILNKVKNPAARAYYLRATHQLGWSRKILLNQIKASSYERSLSANKSHNFATSLPERLAQQAEETLKNSYNLDFLGVMPEMRERELEARLVERLRDFMLELGYGFCFIGKQHRIVLGESEYFVDLLFYHRFLKALVAVELKLGAFEPEFAGKMDFYLNVLNERERAKDDNPSIGIILCAEKDAIVVEFSLKTKTNPIGVAEYELITNLPRELAGKLPSGRQLREVLLEQNHEQATSPRQSPRAESTLHTRRRLMKASRIRKRRSVGPQLSMKAGRDEGERGADIEHTRTAPKGVGNRRRR
ncbi:MAG: PDDEXK nuclease domain-containing protein [Gammaproteobacteria bacterium]